MLFSVATLAPQFSRSTNTANLLRKKPSSSIFRKPDHSGGFPPVATVYHFYARISTLFWTNRLPFGKMNTYGKEEIAHDA